MGEVPRVSPQAGIGGAELPQMGALLRYLQGQVQEGTPVAAVAGVAATGTITITNNANVAEDDTVTVGSTVLTFVEEDPGDGEVEIGGSAGATRDNLLAALEAIAEDEGVVVASSSTAAITVTALQPGTAGNAIALAENSTGITASGSGFLASGVDQVLGTAAQPLTFMTNGTNLYVTLAETTETNTSGWRQITVGSLS